MWVRVLFNLPLIVVVVVILVSIVWGENSYVKRLGYQSRIHQLESEIKRYDDSSALYMRRVVEINAGPEAIEKVAREQYGMKRENEDVFVTDIK